MTRQQFAQDFRLPLDKIEAWERHSQVSDATALAYLLVIERDPDGVRAALGPPIPAE